jgi:hypothetical protein
VQALRNASSTASFLAAGGNERAVGLLPRGHHANNGDVVSVFLRRGVDDSLIPYVTLHGVSLIAMLRMQLVPLHRTRAYHQFVQLPLYEDMAPWNIVFVGVRAGT